ncbi:MAG: NPCBM/NEW2 domain-containing protein [Pirellulales bacterium]
MVTWNLLLTAALVCGPAEFAATTLDGQSASGALVQLDATQAVIETAEGRKTFALESLATLVGAAGAEPAEKPAAAALWVELRDESRIAAQEFTVTAGVARLSLAGGTKVDIPTRKIRWVRFGTLPTGDDPLAKQWNEIAATSAAGDLLLVRKNDQLDYLEGVLGDIDADTCSFEIDAEKVPVKRAKIAGLIYFHAAPDELPEVTARLTAADGSQWAAATVTIDGANVRFKTPGDVELSLPPESVSRMDFSSGKIAYLSDLDPEAVNFVPFFGLKQELPALTAYYGYRRDQGFENQPLLLDGREHRKGLALRSRTTLVYRLPGKFRVFKATAGIDDAVRSVGNAALTIKADGQTVWQGDIRGREPVRELEVNLDGAKRLEIVVDYGDDQDVGDYVNLADARVTK